MALAEVKHPPFTRGKKQLEKVDVDWTRELSPVRIHVERVVGVLKQKFYYYFARNYSHYTGYRQY